MKKLLVSIAVVAVLAIVTYSLVSSFRADDSWAAAGNRAWPGGVGPLRSAGNRYPAQPANDASRKLTALANALPVNDALDAFVAREIARGELAIGDAPTTPDVSAMRELLLREQVVWERPGGVGDLGDQATTARRVVQMRVARFLVADALSKAHDASAWDDLQAAWNLARSLDGQQQMMEQTAALAIARMINAVAWKMPLPAPAWFAGLQARDNVRPLLESFQVQTAWYWTRGRAFPTKWNADSAEHDRAIAAALFGETRCDVSAAENRNATDLTSIWRRAFRYRAEREATANALRVREGKAIEVRSVCSDGAWSFDGGVLRFSREIPVESGMPLVLRVR